MSAIPAVRPNYRPRTEPVERSLPQTRQPVRRRPRVVERNRTNFGAVICVRALSFGFLVAVTYFASALTGQVLVEKARRETIRSSERTRAAMNALDPLKLEIRQANDAVGIEKWAAANGYVAPDWAAAPSSKEKDVVAQNTTH